MLKYFQPLMVNNQKWRITMTYYDEWEQNLAIRLGLFPKKDEDAGDREGDDVEEQHDP